MQTTTDNQPTLDQIITDHAAILPGEPQTVTASGETFIVRPFKFPQYAKAIRAVTRILAILKLQERFTDMAKLAQAEQGEDAEINLGDLLGGLLNFDVIAEICDEAPEEIIGLMMIATGKDRAWFDELEADEGLELAGAVLGVNLSFFIQKIVPAITSAVSRVKAGLSPKLTSSQPTSPAEIVTFPTSTHGPTQ